jgi:hypothetical protein
MSLRLPSSLWLATVPFVIALACAPAMVAQDDGSQSLGDVARDLRRNKSEDSNRRQSAEPPVIDNDNFAQVMEDARKARPIAEDKTVFSIDSANKTIKVSSPDVTCSLSFNSRNSSLLIKPVLVEDLPLDELLKIDGPGSIQDDTLQLEVFNGTDWELREITIGFTLERKPGENAEVAADARIIPAAQIDGPSVVERRSDVTILYHLKAEVRPFSKTSFNEKIGVTPAPDEDWRWSIVEAKGIRPQQTPFLPDSLLNGFLGSQSSGPTNLP